MKRIPFDWKGQAHLADELCRPVKDVTAQIDTIGRPSSITLWRADGTGLRIQSEMHDLAERIEVGILRFETVLTAYKDEQLGDASGAFNAELKALKMEITESGTIAESGFILRTVEGLELLVLASASPYFLWTSGVFTMREEFKPEYPLKNYQIVAV
jgi:hypothetical protein